MNGKLLVLNNKLKMKSRKFNSIMPYYNHKWAAEVLKMELNKRIGPDLVDDYKFLELKFTLVNPKKHKDIKYEHYPKCWTVLENQVSYEYQEEKSGYWGLGFYELNKAVRGINSIDNNLENLVLFRELYIVKWNWMKKFPPHHTNGKTVISKWDNTLRYPKYSQLPRTVKTYEVERGKVHLTKGVSLDDFKIDGNLENKGVLVEEVSF